MSTISRQVISLVAGVLAGVIVATLACRYEAEQALSRAEFLLSTTQIRWNVAVLEALATFDSSRAAELLDRQVDSKTSNLAAVVQAGARLDAEDVQVLENAIRERRARGRPTDALERILSSNLARGK